MSSIIAWANQLVGVARQGVGSLVDHPAAPCATKTWVCVMESRAQFGIVVLRLGLRYLALHTGLPVLVVAALALVVGYRLLKRTVRFAAEVLAISALLVMATELGWIRW